MEEDYLLDCFAIRGKRVEKWIRESMSYFDFVVFSFFFELSVWFRRVIYSINYIDFRNLTKKNCAYSVRGSKILAFERSRTVSERVND